MAQNDFAIPNQGGQAFRLDVQNALQSLAGHSSGATDPNTAVGTTYPYQFWADTTTGIMKMRNGADTAWIDLFQLDGEWSTIAFENGTAAAPSIYFKDSGTDTGFYSPGANQVGITTGGTSALVVDASQNVGIGTATFDGNWTPKLQVSGTASDGSQGILIENYKPAITFKDLSGGSPERKHIWADTNSLFLGTGDTAQNAQLTINSSGNVGIGTTSPVFGVGSGLEIERAGSATLRIEDSVSGSGFEIQNASGEISFNGYNTQPFVFTHNTSERARIDSSGRVLVGTTTSPSAGNGQYGKLVVQSYVGSATGGAYVSLQRGEPATTPLTNGAEIARINFGDSVGYDFAAIQCYVDGTSGASDYPGRLVFSTTADGASSPTERMRITSGGDIGFGDNVDFTNLPGDGTGTATGVAIDGGVLKACRNEYAMQIGVNATGASKFLAQFFQNGTACGSIQVSNSNATAYVTSSDYRLKENVSAIDGAISKLQSLNPCCFSFKNNPGTVVQGFIAHEVQGVVPEAIAGEKDAVDDEGNPVYQGIDQSKLVPLLTAALQEAIAKIETLEAKVAALEGN